MTTTGNHQSGASGNGHDTHSHERKGVHRDARVSREAPRIRVGNRIAALLDGAHRYTALCRLTSIDLEGLVVIGIILCHGVFGTLGQILDTEGLAALQGEVGARCVGSSGCGSIGSSLRVVIGASQISTILIFQLGLEVEIFFGVSSKALDGLADGQVAVGISVSEGSAVRRLVPSLYAHTEAIRVSEVGAPLDSPLSVAQVTSTCTL